MMKRILALACLVLASTGAFAQTATGNVFGTVTDTSGAVLPGASVSISGEAGTRTTVSGSDGSFRGGPLRGPATYSAKVMRSEVQLDPKDAFPRLTVPAALDARGHRSVRRAAIDDPLGEVVREILEHHFAVGERLEREGGFGLARRSGDISERAIDLPDLEELELRRAAVRRLCTRSN